MIWLFFSLIACGSEPTETLTVAAMNVLQIRVVNEENQPIGNAQASLQTGSMLPINEKTDDNGIALFALPTDTSGQSAQIQISKNGYITVNEFRPIDFQQDQYFILKLPPSPTPTVPIVPTNTSTSTSTPTNTPIPATDTSTPTLTPIITATSISSIETATPDPFLATITNSASLFRFPDAFSQVLRILNTTEQIRVLGRTEDNAWLYVQHISSNLEGFVQLRLTSWKNSEQINQLLASVPLVTSDVTTPTPPPVLIDLTIDLYPLTGSERCDGPIWEKDIYLAGQGGDGNYKYFNNGEELIDDQPDDTSIVFTVRNAGGAILVKGTVVSGDGQIASHEILVQAHDRP